MNAIRICIANGSFRMGLLPTDFKGCIYSPPLPLHSWHGLLELTPFPPSLPASWTLGYWKETGGGCCRSWTSEEYFSVHNWVSHLCRVIFQSCQITIFTQIWPIFFPKNQLLEIEVIVLKEGCGSREPNPTEAELPTPFSSWVGSQQCLLGLSSLAPAGSDVGTDAAGWAKLPTPSFLLEQSWVDSQKYWSGQLRALSCRDQTAHSLYAGPGGPSAPSKSATR